MAEFILNECKNSKSDMVAESQETLGMKPKEIEEFKRKLEIEYNKALKAVVQLPPVDTAGGIFVLIFRRI